MLFFCIQVKTLRGQMKEFDWVSEKNISGKFLVAAKYMIWIRNSCLVLAVLLANYTYICIQNRKKYLGIKYIL